MNQSIGMGTPVTVTLSADVWDAVVNAMRMGSQGERDLDLVLAASQINLAVALAEIDARPKLVRGRGHLRIVE